MCVLVTGDELVHTGVPGPGRVRDALGPLPTRPGGGHRPAFLQGAVLADALAAVPPEWQPGEAVPLLLLS